MLKRKMFVTLTEEFDAATRLRLEELSREACRVFGGEDAANEWANNPARALSGAKPLDLSIESAAAHQRAITFLHQIEYGVYI